MCALRGWLRGLRRGTRVEPGDPEGQAFARVVEKFSRIQYLVEKKAVLDVIEKTPVAICITNERRQYEYVNPAYTRLYGYSYDELVGKSFTIVVPEEYRAQLVDLHDRFMRRQYELEGEWEVVRRDGRRMTILANAAYVLDEQDNPRKITFVLDITERKKAEADLVAERARREAMETFLRGPLREALRSLADRSPEAALAVRSLETELDALLDNQPRNG